MGEGRFSSERFAAITYCMSDQHTSLQELKDIVTRFVDARDWSQFHSPKNLSMALAIEASELMEHVQWITPEASRKIDDDPAKLQDVSEELADILCYVLAVAVELGIDLDDALRAKMVKNEIKYPAEEYRGRYGPEDNGS